MTDAETPGPAAAPAAAPAADAQPRPPRPPRTATPAAATPPAAPAPAGEAEPPAERDCYWCTAGPGLFLIVLAGGLAYMGFDLMTGGRVSRWLAGGGQDEGGGDDRPA